MLLEDIVGMTPGMWVSPAGQIISVTNTHIDDVINHPAKFGLTLEYIQEMYKRFNERVGQEGEAREEIIRNVLTRGWIRVRKYRNYWSITLESLKDSTKRIVRDFVSTLVKAGKMHENDDIKVLELRSDNLKTLEASDIIDHSLEESVQDLPLVGYDQVADMSSDNELYKIMSDGQAPVKKAFNEIEKLFKKLSISDNIIDSMLLKLKTNGYLRFSVQGRGITIRKYDSPDKMSRREHDLRT